MSLIECNFIVDDSIVKNTLLPFKPAVGDILHLKRVTYEIIAEVIDLDDNSMNYVVRTPK